MDLLTRGWYNGRYDTSAYLTDSDDEEEIPSSILSAAAGARPRAPSGGSVTLPTPTSTPAVDLLGLGSPSPVAPQPTAYTDFFGSTGSSGSPVSPQPTASTDFFGSTGSSGSPVSSVPSTNLSWDTFGQQINVPQQQMGMGMNQQPMTMGGMPMGQQTFQQPMGGMGGQTMNQPPQQQTGTGGGTQTLNGQIRRTTANSPAKPQLSEADSKDPWKKGANLISLDSLTKKNPEPVIQATGQKIPLSMGQQHTAQYSNLHMVGNMGGNSMMGGNMNMMGGNVNANMMRNQNMNMMGGNMMGGNPNMMNNMNGNMMGGNPNMGMGGNMNMMGGNPNMMNNNMGKRW